MKLMEGQLSEVDAAMDVVRDLLYLLQHLSLKECVVDVRLYLLTQ